MSTRASIIERRASLATEFGKEYAERLFGRAILDQLPRYVRGPRKGEIKGYLVWNKCDRGGWHRHSGRVIYPNTLIRASLRTGPDSSYPALVACIPPRTTPDRLDFSGDLLGEHGEKLTRFLAA